MTWTLWNSIRVLVTLAGIYTVSRFTSPVVPFNQLLICSVIAIVVMRIWMPSKAELLEPERSKTETFTSEY